MVESSTMLIGTAQVQNGTIEVDDLALPEGTKVTILVREGDETFALTPDEESKLMAAIAEADRGEFGHA